ncbi:MAG: hypothetical protein IJ498_07400 [Akkermansia sp.]|nr:hypothetical protein [Akkermansia sp.]
MHNAAIPFIISLIVIFCITEAILSYRRGERGLLGEPKFNYSIFDAAHLPMWIIIGLDTIIFFAYYLLSE